MSLQSLIDDYKIDIVIFQNLLLTENNSEEIEIVKDRMKIKKENIREYISLNIPILNAYINLKECCIL